MTLTGAEDEVETLEWLKRAKISPMVGEPDGPPIHYAQYAPPRARDLLVQAGFYLSRLSFRLGVPADLPDMIGGQSLAERSMEMRGPGETVPLVCGSPAGNPGSDAGPARLLRAMPGVRRPGPAAAALLGALLGPRRRSRHDGRVRGGAAAVGAEWTTC